MKIPYRKLGMADDYTERDVLSRELSEQITLAVESLPPKQKKVFVLTEYEGASCKQIALETGCNVRTVNKLKRRAEKNLRKRLGPYMKGEL